MLTLATAANVKLAARLAKKRKGAGCFFKIKHTKCHRDYFFFVTNKCYYGNSASKR